jgi:hypothetical protein
LENHLRSIICEKKESANLKDKDANQRGKTVSTPNPVRGGEGFVCFAVKTKGASLLTRL